MSGFLSSPSQRDSQATLLVTVFFVIARHKWFIVVLNRFDVQNTPKNSSNLAAEQKRTCTRIIPEKIRQISLGYSWPILWVIENGKVLNMQ